MTRRHLLASLDTGQVEAAIGAAEAACAVELRVSIAGLFWGDPQAFAQRAFTRLEMAATRRRNGLLILIVPWRRRVVVVADEGITARVDPGHWSAAVATITAAFRDGRFTDGLVAALADLARALAPHFPPGPRANELPDVVDRG
jgi:uncharacterized membrane protein